MNIERAIQISIGQLYAAIKQGDRAAELILRARLSRLFYEAACNGTVYQKVMVH